MRINVRYIAIIIIGLLSCNAPIDKKPHAEKPTNIIQSDAASKNDLAQLELKDSALLTHIKGQFYKSKQGQLFERTIADRDIEGVDTLVSVEYFNGTLPQDIDPLTFEELDGWYAKDKNFAYYYRPTSGGMLCVKLDKADVESFKILSGQYMYAVDNKHVYKESEILEKINPLKMKIIKDKDGQILKIISGQTTYMAD